MACFVVPASEAIITTIVTKIVEKKEDKKQKEAFKEGICLSEFNKERFSVKLKRLSSFLWGGSFLLAFEHLWHGEIQPFFPFLTANANSWNFTEVIREMMTVGVGMAAVITFVWGIITFLTITIEKKNNVSDLNINIQK